MRATVCSALMIDKNADGHSWLCCYCCQLCIVFLFSKQFITVDSVQDILCNCLNVCDWKSYNIVTLVVCIYSTFISFCSHRLHIDLVSVREFHFVSSLLAHLLLLVVLFSFLILSTLNNRVTNISIQFNMVTGNTHSCVYINVVRLSSHTRA